MVIIKASVNANCVSGKRIKVKSKKMGGQIIALNEN